MWGMHSPFFRIFVHFFTFFVIPQIFHIFFILSSIFLQFLQMRFSSYNFHMLYFERCHLHFLSNFFIFVIFYAFSLRVCACGQILFWIFPQNIPSRKTHPGGRDTDDEAPRPHNLLNLATNTIWKQGKPKHHKLSRMMTKVFWEPGRP